LIVCKMLVLTYLKPLGGLACMVVYQLSEVEFLVSQGHVARVRFKLVFNGS
jgi:hypothetical protein